MKVKQIYRQPMTTVVFVELRNFCHDVSYWKDGHGGTGLVNNDDDDNPPPPDAKGYIWDDDDDDDDEFCDGVINF